MGMASFSDDKTLIESEFNSLQQSFKVFASQHKKINLSQKTTNLKPQTLYLSMGMSGDYPIAIACGSNMIRVGSLIFGARK